MQVTFTSSTKNKVCSSDTLVQGESIQLHGFGNFDIRRYAIHEGMNPSTGEKVQVKPKKLPRFKVSKDMRLKVNEK